MEDDTPEDATEDDAEDGAEEDDDETLPPDEDELAEALDEASAAGAPRSSAVDLTLEDGANADNPIGL